MHGAPAEVVAVALLAFSLAVAVYRPRGVSEAVVVVPAAGLVVLLGIVPADAAGRTLRELAPTVGFLAAILVFGHLCDEAGVFAYLGARAAAAAQNRPRRLLVLVVVLAAGVTAVLTLDATVVLLTPVVLAVTRRSALSVRPYGYACVRLANSGSLLLPVSNLTNLLAFSSIDLSFGRFAALMFLPWLLACAGEWLGLRGYFRRDLPATGSPPAITLPVAPRYALTVLAVTVCGFVLLSSLDVPVAWAAGAGCALLLAPRLRRREVSPVRLLEEASLGFCAFVLALAVVVDGVARHGLGSAMAHLVPSGSSLFALLGVAFLSALLANVVNNLPATLVLLPLVATSPASALAMLVGVNVGPNATFGGSLATLLWRRMLPARERPRVHEFHTFALLTVPMIVAVTTVGLWVAVQVVGT